MKFDTPAPSTGHYLEGGDSRLHYLDYGTAGATPMLCIHGAAAHAHWYDYVAAAFTDRFHVRSLDLRGHGNSAWSTGSNYSHLDFAADIEHAAEQLDLRDFVLIGHSMGGLASITYAASRPWRLARLIIVDARPKLEDEAVANLRNYSRQPARRYASLDELVERYSLQPAGTTASSGIVRDMASKGAKQLDDGSWAHKFDRRLHAERVVIDGFQYWREIKIPSLLVTGQLSARVDASILAEVSRCCPQLETACVANSNHHVTLDNPAGFAAAIRPFLTR